MSTAQNVAPSGVTPTNPTFTLPAHAMPVDTTQIDWVPLKAGLSFKPITFFPANAGWQLLLRIEPGVVIDLHRHSGEVHAFNLQGSRAIIGTDIVIGPLTYIHEPAGNTDTWMAVGDEPCIVHIEVNGRLDYFDADGKVDHIVDADIERGLYLDWCAVNGVEPQYPLTVVR